MKDIDVLETEAKKALFGMANKVEKEVKNGIFEDIEQDHNYASVLDYLTKLDYSKDKGLIAILFMGIATLAITSKFEGVNGLFLSFALVSLIFIIVKTMMLFKTHPVNLLDKLSSSQINSDIMEAIKDKMNINDDLLAFKKTVIITASALVVYAVLLLYVSVYFGFIVNMSFVEVIIAYLPMIYFLSGQRIYKYANSKR